MNQEAGKALASCRVAARGSAIVPLAQVDAIRAKLAQNNGKPIPLKHVKNSDEQTIAGLSALFQAVRAAGWEERTFRDWGVVGAPRFLGRMSVTTTLNKYLTDPRYSVSPHIIPNQSLHSLASTVSLVLNVQGPNFGVGGGPQHVADAFLAGLRAAISGRQPGVWLVISEFDPEPIPDVAGKPTNDVVAHAVALALEPGDGSSQLQLLAKAAGNVSLGVAELAGFVAEPSTQKRAWQCPVPGLGTLELSLN